MGEFYVCEGATCTCTCGSTPATLIVTSQEIKTVDGLLAATILDYEPTTNIPAFGTCTLLTAAANGVSTPCIPVTVAPWTPGSTILEIDALTALTMASTLTCTVGGTIAIELPSNEIAEGE